MGPVMRTYKFVFSAIVIAGLSVPSFGQTKQTGALKVGAAKVDVTPSESELPKTYEGIHDHLYSRAIVIENGITSSALITLDAGGLSDQLWQSVSQRAEKE